MAGFAERVLFGDQLADKLAPPTSFDDHPGPALTVLPPGPHRPVGLRLDDARSRPPPPRRADLDAPNGRGRVLHGFANHELLALELMALMLLRFPDAPSGWRLGLVQTMADEQRHLQAYLDRMSACSVAFGSEPVSGFFWDTLAAAPDPLAFTAAMGLGFEQANLDFAQVWMKAFAAAGDHATAAVLEEVYEDEIRHVRHGLSWYRRMSGGELDFDGWVERLSFPMSAARARGPEVDREGRRRVGIPEAYTRRLEVSGSSRGRPPTVWAFSCTLEDEVAGRAAGKAAKGVQSDLQHLPLLLAHHEDVVLAEPASVDFLQGLRAAGFVPAELTTVAGLAGRTVGALRPWGWSPNVASQLSGLGPSGWVEAARPLWGKDAACAWQEGLLAGVACRSVEEVQAALPDGPWVIKARWSASGTQRVRGEGPLPAKGPVARWVGRDGLVVVQRWLDRVLDLSVHGDVTDDGPRHCGVVRFETGPGGVFRGAFVGPWLHGLEPALQRFAHEHDVDAQLHAAWMDVATWAHGLGYRGPLGVDAMVVDHGGLRVVPVVEINPRMTMGRVAWMLRRRVSGRARGWWRIRALASFDGEPPAAWMRAQQVERPLAFDGAKLLHGVVPTNDPRVAKTVVSWLAL